MARQYYWLVLYRALTETLQWFDLHDRKGWAKLVVPPLIAFVAKWSVSGFRLVRDEILGSAVIAVLVSLGWFLVVLFVTLIFVPTKIDKEKQDAITQLQNDKNKLLERQEPKLEIIFRQGPPFEQSSSIFDQNGQVVSGQQMIYRVGIRNASTTTAIDDITVVLESIEPNVISFLPVPLHQMHDNPALGQSHRTHFDLNPGDTKYIDVASTFSGADDPQLVNQFMLWYAVPAPSTLIPVSAYKLSISANGRNSLAVSKGFLLGVDTSSRYFFRPE